MSTVQQGQGQAAAPAAFSALPVQVAASVAGTMIGEALGDTLAEKLVAGILIAVIGAFLTAPGKRRRRRIVAVAVLLALLDMLRRAAGALASTGREERRAAPRTSHSWVPANWAAIGLTAFAGFGLGSLGTTAMDGWASEPDPKPHGATPGPGSDPSNPGGSRGSGTRVIEIPAVRGKTEAVARRLLEQNKLTPISATEPSALLDEGIATRTAPAQGVIARQGATVTLYVSSGRPPADARVEIPPVAGLPKPQARTLLKDRGLRVFSEYRPSATIATERATGTSPPAGKRVRAGSKVTLYVSSGPPGERVTIPSVRGRSEREALDLLRGAKLNPEPVAQPAADVPSGHAIQTDPPAGSRVEKGESVTLYVSSGTRRPATVVPDLIGTQVDDAAKRLAERDLRADVTYAASTEPEGAVIAADPSAGSTVEAGAHIALTASDGSLVRVPDVIGMHSSKASAKLEAGGLTSKTVFVTSEKEGGTVVSTDPTPGDEVGRGTLVVLSVSNKPG